jgi:LacI family transcriptional regulator
MAQNRKPRKVTMKDIASTLGVSINTVSKALGNKPDISLGTKEQVYKTARELGYEYEIIPKSWHSHRTNVVGLVIADNSNPFFAKVVKSVERTLQNSGYALILCNTDEDYRREKSIIALLVERKIDGIILTPTQSNDEDIAFLLSKKTPFVLLGRHFSSYKVPCVIADDRGGAYEATNHLARLGHKRILFINAPSYISSAAERLEGYRAAFRDNGIVVNESLIRSCEPKMENAYNEMKGIMLEELDFSAVFTFSDQMMLGVVRVFHERGIRVPQDCSLVGFDDIDFASIMTPPLTTIVQDTDRLGTESATMLLKMINGQEITEATKVIPTKAIIRGSTQKYGVSR